MLDQHKPREVCPSLDALQTAYDEVTDNLPIATSISEKTADYSRLTIVPNPSSGIYAIDILDYSAETMVVTDLQGKTIVTLTGTAIMIDITEEPAGLYVLTAYGPRGAVLATKKLVKTDW